MNHFVVIQLQSLEKLEVDILSYLVHIQKFMVPLLNFDRSEIVITQIKRLGQSHLLTNFVKTNLPN